MKRYSKISGATLVDCDARGCAHEQFRSCSVPAVIDLQLLEAGWSIIEIEVKNTLAWETEDSLPDAPSNAGRPPDQRPSLAREGHQGQGRISVRSQSPRALTTLL